MKKRFATYYMDVLTAANELYLDGGESLLSLVWRSLISSGATFRQDMPGWQHRLARR